MSFKSKHTMVSKKYITIELLPKQHEKLTELAAEHRMKVSMYGQQLFEAAFAARVGVQPDPAIDAVVARVALLWGMGTDNEIIARELGISKRLVKLIVKAWQDEVLGRAA